MVAMLTCDVCGSRVERYIMVSGNIFIGKGSNRYDDYWLLTNISTYCLCSKACFDQLVFSETTDGQSALTENGIPLERVSAADVS